MLTWIYDEAGRAGAILDEFCIRSIEGVARAWVFGVSVFSVKGEHIGWFEHGVLFDLDNARLGFIGGAIGLGKQAPQLQAAPPAPLLGKRPCVPALRARRARPAAAHWSGERLGDYLDHCDSIPSSAQAGVGRPCAPRPVQLDPAHEAASSRHTGAVSMAR